MSLKTENSRRVPNLDLKGLIRWKYHEIIWINPIAYMEGEYPKGGGDIPGAFAPRGGRYSLDIRPPGAVFLAPFWEGGESPGGETKVLWQRHGQIAVPF
jgi:hypothetical protein